MKKASTTKIIPSPTSRKSDAQQHVYHDRDSLPFNASYPLITFANDKIKISDTDQKIEKYMLQNYWYQKAAAHERDAMLKRVSHLNKNLSIIFEFLNKRYVPLGFSVLHISIAGSYSYALEPGDIDFDVVLNGSHFDYFVFNEGIEIVDLTGSVRKMSFTVMGIDNINGTSKVADEIKNEGFTHHDTIIREMLVAPMRNITVYGAPFSKEGNIDSRNVLVRIARQLYFAQLTLEGKIPYYEKEPLRSKKAIRRIKEAHEIIDWLLGSSAKL